MLVKAFLFVAALATSATAAPVQARSLPPGGLDPIPPQLTTATATLINDVELQTLPDAAGILEGALTDDDNHNTFGNKRTESESKRQVFTGLEDIVADDIFALTP